MTRLKLVLKSKSFIIPAALLAVAAAAAVVVKKKVDEKVETEEELDISE